MNFPRDVTALIPHIPVRPNSLARAVKSVVTQTQRVTAIAVEVDNDRTGSAATRNRALDRVDTEWTAFLDDDDWWLPHHVDTLLRAAERFDVDVVYPGCRVVDAAEQDIPVIEEWGRFGWPFSAELLRQKSYIPVTSLVRSELACRARFGPPAGVETNYDDWGFYVRLLDLGARFYHVPEITWVWHHSGKNTSGRSDRW